MSRIVPTQILKLPYPPSVNTYWRRAGNRTYISKRGLLFKQSVAEYVADNSVATFGDQPVEVLIVIRPRSKNFMDVDNCAKAILDALEGSGVFDDDKQVWRLVLERGEPLKGGGCVVAVSNFEGPQ